MLTMKFAATTTSDGEVITVTPDGHPLSVHDVDCRMLHVLPKFFAPLAALGHLGQDDVELKVTSSLGEIVPAGGLVIRQPYPNRRYFVGGSTQMRNGWVIRLPEDASSFNIQFEWFFPMAYRWMSSDDWEVRHLIHVTLLPGAKRVYTMDANCWPRAANAGPLGRTPVSLSGHAEDGDSPLDGRDIVQLSGLCPQDDPSWLVGHYIEERLSIPPIAYEQAWSITAFEEEQIHEVAHATTFSDADDAKHRANATLEMPAERLLNAIRLAREIPFDKKSAFAISVEGRAGGCESHPAMKILNEWWTEQRPDAKGIAVGFAMPWVRVRDDGEYWCGYHETPNESVDVFVPCKTSAARVGDLVLVLFHASWEHFTYEKHGVAIYLADGQPFSHVGVDRSDVLSGEYDESWYALQALESFPDRFPVAYEALQKL